jgi:enamine deaminase RidA (YjgF/YER057c/UK114 family)
MPKQHVSPPSLFSSTEHGFSQVVVASGAKTVFISGQTAWDANKKIVGRSLGEQTRQALRNVKLAVEAAGGNLRDIVSLRIYIVHRAEQNLEPVGSALREVFPIDPPTSTWIGVSSLAVPDFLIEIEATAVLEHDIRDQSGG